MNLSELEALYEGKLREFVRAHRIAIENLTEEQIASALCQAIQAGDFQRHISHKGNAQTVIYIPFAERERLNARIKELERRLEKLGLNADEL